MIVVNKRSIEIFNGVMLSDGHLQHTGSTSCFKINLGGHEHVDWLAEIKLALLNMDVAVYSQWPKFGVETLNGKQYEYTRMNSVASSILEREHSRWYDGHTKIVPNDISITPITLAHWFMGDGSSSYKADSTAKHTYVQVELSTFKFTYDEVSRLVEQIRLLGVDAVHLQMQRGKPTIRIGYSESVNQFMLIVSPYLCESYKYKIKMAS